MSDKQTTEAIPTIKVRLRVCIYEDSQHSGTYSYFIDDYSEMSASTHTVWIEADVPVRSQPVIANVLV